jgi:hypothetical protein
LASRVSRIKTHIKSRLTTIRCMRSPCCSSKSRTACPPVSRIRSPNASSSPDSNVLGLTCRVYSPRRRPQARQEHRVLRSVLQCVRLLERRSLRFTPYLRNVPILAVMAVLLVVVIMFLVVLLVTAVVVLVDHRVAFASDYQIAVYREGRHEGYSKRHCQTSPKQEIQQTRLHGTR